MDGQDEEAVVICRVWEPEVDGDLEAQLQSLLRRCFSGYPVRSYFKVPPHFRYVATSRGSVVAQMGVELRMFRVGDEVVRVFGVVDLCVDEGRRSQGLASRLLRGLIQVADGKRVDFVVLFAHDDRLYVRNGWVHVANRCTWVKIDSHRTLGLATNESLADVMMVKAVGSRQWPDGDIDLLGHVF
ncbi:MAG: GNAT family N-acetyltransferase [Actinobacteria bacterium]|nr:GNAT family N-acetyltransferase [Actinomycetota bacterium]